MKVLVIGGTRFIGVATVSALLQHDHEVTLFNRGTRVPSFADAVRQLRGDRRQAADLAQLEGSAFDAVVDFAAYRGDDVRLLLAVQGHLERWIHISSGTVYALEPLLPWDEETPYGPEPLWGEYARGKIECEEVLRTCRTGAQMTVALRMPWVLGPGSYADRESFVLNRLLDRAEILLPGDGKALQQFLSSGQVAESVVAILERPAEPGWRAFNLASPGYLSLCSFVTVCARVAGREPIVRSVGGGATGTGSVSFDMANAIFPFPNESYLLDIAAAGNAGVAPRAVPVEDVLAASLDDLLADPSRRAWRRTPAEERLLAVG